VAVSQCYSKDADIGKPDGAHFYSMVLIRCGILAGRKKTGRGALLFYGPKEGKKPDGAHFWS
jgi:hypothetical protein